MSIERPSSSGDVAEGRAHPNREFFSLSKTTAERGVSALTKYWTLTKGVSGQHVPLGESSKIERRPSSVSASSFEQRGLRFESSLVNFPIRDRPE